MVYAGEEKKMAGRSVKKADRGGRLAGKRRGCKNYGGFEMGKGLLMRICDGESDDGQSYDWLFWFLNGGGIN